MTEPKIKTGTTILGMIGTDGVLIASESRSTVSTIIATEESDKLYEINNHIVMAGAGMGGDIQALSKMLQVEAKLFKTRNGRPISVEATVSMLGVVLHEYKFSPFYVGLIIGGVDANGTPKLYAVDPAGDIAPVSDHTAFAGSGWLSAEAIMDDSYKKMEVKELVPLAVRAINAAKKRDSASGGDPNIALITKDGIRRLKKDELAKLTESDKKRK